MTQEWDNEERRRYYGLRKGDIVNACAFGEVWANAVVHAYTGDNNRVRLITAEGKEVDFVAEWCQIVKKVDE